MKIFNFAEIQPHELSCYFKLADNPPPTSGYKIGDASLLSQFHAQQNQAGFFETFTSGNNDLDDRIDNFLPIAVQHKNIITGDIIITPEIGDNGYTMFVELVRLFAFIQQDSDIPFEKIVIPLCLSYPSDHRRTHSLSLCVYTDQSTRATDIVLIEQHMKQDGGFLDFSQPMNDVFNILRQLYADSSQIRTFINQESICPIGNVCGIVSSEICRRLLQSENPLNFARNKENLKISAQEIPLLHQQNVQIAQALTPKF